MSRKLNLTTAFYVFVKDLLDSVFSLLLIFLLSPVLLVLFLSTRIFLGPTPVFKQVRTGQHGKTFTIYKFRTMKNIYDETGKLMPDSVRLTTYGRFLRSTSLDELPTLFNVFLGQMSFVGPRPFVIMFPEYPPNTLSRFICKPGITGLAQINGRNSLSWNRKFAYDRWYARNRSLFLDLLILLLTPFVILRARGISSPNHSTAPSFTPSKSRR